MSDWQKVTPQLNDALYSMFLYENDLSNYVFWNFWKDAESEGRGKWLSSFVINGHIYTFTVMTKWIFVLSPVLHPLAHF